MLSQKLALAAAGNAAAATYVDDVFSCDLWAGNTTTQTITNGIDLSGEGGLVWIKDRGSDSHHIFDTERGAGFAINSNTTNAQASDTQISSQKDLYQFNSTGYSIGQNYNSYVNANGSDYVGWAFRKCPGFFDVVTYTGTGSNQNISHNLGSVPGMIIVKKYSATGVWGVYHRSLGNTKKITLNETTEAETFTDYWNSTTPTSTQFTVGTNSSVNASGASYVAYIFAHDDQSFGDDGDEAIIKCGSYTGSGSAGNSVNVGFEPQWLLVKKSSASGDWHMYDNMRGIVTGGQDQTLLPHSTLAENQASSNVVRLDATGFTLEDSSTQNASSSTYIYIAIRRPHKPPETAAECFDVFEQTGSSSTQLRPGTSGSGVTDMAIIKNVDNNYDWVLGARLLGGTNLIPNSTATESTSKFGTSVNVWDQMSGTELQSGVAGTNLNSSNNYINYHFTRKPGFFDVVTWTGDGTSGRQIKHNLGVVPEMVVFKNRTSASLSNWVTYHKDLGIDTANHESQNMMLNSSASAGGFGGLDIHSEQTSAHFTLRSNAASAGNYSSVEYLGFCFASLAGISKVGSYTGTGSDIDIDCGFTNGARFVLIKRTDSSDNWVVYNTASGINSGNEPYLRLNLDNAEVTGSDRLDPLSSGFTVGTGSFSINQSGGTYIYLAIA